ncbi:thiamine phosphate synthase [Oscillospiraceae bacterium PP1C4]
MKVDKDAMLLYVVTDRTWLGKNDLAAQVEDTIKAGATFVQLREKHLDFDAFVAQAKQIKQVTDRYKIPFVINDNIEVALACGADGVHVGQKDMKAGNVRSLLGEDKILGVSANTVEQAIAAQQAGADYLGVGAVFSTSTKLDANDVTFDTLKAICNAVSIPVVAIGGISEQNLMKLQGSGVDGVAVISAIFAQPDIHAAAKRIHDLSQRMVSA